MSEAQDGIFYAHSENAAGRWQTMFEHTVGTEEAPGVARLARANAEPFGMGDQAYLAGLLHDIGKYGARFQMRLRGQEKGLDHWSAGAWIALKEYLALDVALAVQGHHIGLQQGSVNDLLKLDPQRLGQNHPLGLRLSEANLDLLKERLESDGITLPTPNLAVAPMRGTASTMLDVRMLFSALVDADFLDTERHMREGRMDSALRPAGAPLQTEKALERLNVRLNALACNETIPDSVRRVRGELADACRRAGRNDEEALLWTLTAPTGTGKTLAMLLFALERALRQTDAKPPIRRIVVVLPYLSIIDQTVRVYRDLFPAAQFGEHYLLEHHSLANESRREKEKEKASEERDAEAEAKRQARLLTQNWDAPIVITTSVQFLESLFSNRSSACRKLHHLAGSVILFDEVQTLPLGIAVATLKALSRLATPRYGTTVVFATATQPAFNMLDADIRESEENEGWQPREIVPASLNLYERARRVVVDWSRAQAPTSWDEVAQWIADAPQTLCIVNLKRHARDLARRLHKRHVPVCHLSTNLCPAHRKRLLRRITSALKKGKPCRVVATQCVECGVDLDFPLVFRAFGPLDSIAQAAGRCNREGKLSGSPGQMVVFLPNPDDKLPYPPGIYEQAAGVTAMLLAERGGDGMDIHDPELFTIYFHRLYQIADMKRANKELQKAIEAQDYASVGERYRVIPHDGVNVVVPYKKGEALIDEARENGLTADWVRRARRYAVSQFPMKEGMPSHLEPVHLARNGEIVPDWFLCPLKEYYDEDLGLLLEEGPGFYSGIV